METSGPCLAESSIRSIPSDVMIIPSMFQQRYDTPPDAHEPGLVKPVKGDGNCLFWSFSYVITGSEEHHLEIRRWVVHKFVQGENRSIQR